MKKSVKKFRRALSLMMTAVLALSLTLIASPVITLAETYPEQEGINNTSPTAEGRVVDKSVYMDKNQPIEVRVKALLDQMTLREKVGQMTQLERPSNANAKNYYIGSVLSGGGSTPNNNYGLSTENGGDGTGNTVSGWLDSYDQWQTAMDETPLGIPILYEIDAVHGTVHAPGTTVFPHASGAASGDPQLMERIGTAVATEMRALELFASFSPAIVMGQNPRWGRYHEGWGHDRERNGIFGNYYSMGFQGGKPDKWDGLDTGEPGDKNQYAFLGNGAQVVGTMKHFTTEGSTVNGANAGNGFYYNPNFPIVGYGAYANPLSIDQLQNMKALKELTPAQLKADPEIMDMLNAYRIMIEGGVRSLMPSYNYFNGLRMHEFTSMLDVIKKPVSEGGFGFTGFVVSDYNSGHGDPYAPNSAANIQTYMDFFYGKQTHFDGSAFTAREVRIAAFVNAGGDMDMAVSTPAFGDDLLKLARSGIVPISRIDDAVTRILRVKFELGLFDRPTLVKAETGETRNERLAAATTKAKAQIRKPETVALARQAVRESMVLLKNKDGVMATLKDVPGDKIMVAGRFANNIGWQLGGWTRVWQGQSSTDHSFYAGETLLEAIAQVKTDGNFGANGAGSGAQFNITGARNAGDENEYDVVLVTVGETAYAEGNGDTTLTGTVLGSIVSHTLQLHPTDYTALQNAKANYPGAKIIVISYSARPLVLDNIIDDIDAYVQVWWPGTEGLGMTDVLFGDYDFTGKTAFPWYWHPEWIGFNDDPSKPYMFDIGAGLAKNEEYNDATPIPVRPSGDLRQGSAIVIRPTGASVISGTIYTWVANASNSVTSPNYSAEPFKPTYSQPVYGKGGLLASTRLTTPTTANWCGDTWVEYKINVVRGGTYNVSFARTGSGTAADAVRILVDGVEKASYTVGGMTAPQSVELGAGEHILRVAFASSAQNVTVTSINIAASDEPSAFAADVDTLVAGYDANINVSGAEGTRAVLVSSSRDIVAEANLVDGGAKLSVPKDKAVAGAYFLMVYDGDNFVGSKDLSIVPLPDDVWSFSVETESNMIKAYFNTTIALDPARFDVVLNGVSVGGTLEAGGKSINFSDVNASNYVGGEDVIISGVRLPGLFPDYVFTYRGKLEKK
ncbi:MAG: glycoside hydrolase family 3 C-terminal domain-containing protein [Oscillospiraceae bacterium]|jgi:beta-glucosidase|nr:glycoside hydrolase family 3 C-terminal domain-containing protein [Oscillospiraceae bacterium]